MHTLHFFVAALFEKLWKSLVTKQTVGRCGRKQTGEVAMYHQASCVCCSLDILTLLLPAFSLIRMPFPPISFLEMKSHSIV